MTIATAARIANQVRELGWNARIEMGMRGEPSLNPNIREIITILHHHLPKAYMLLISNGAGFQENTLSTIHGLFATGLSTIVVDDYEGISWSRRIQTVMLEAAKKNELDRIDIYFYPECVSERNPHKRSRKKRLVFIPPINTITHGTHSVIFNHGACGGPPTDEKQGQRCSRPFREMTFRHDGHVPLCCSDWRGAYPIGHIDNISLEELWNHSRMIAARKYIYHGIRTFRPCAGCDCTGFRLGLLPDKKGQETLPEPNEKDAAIVEEALAAGPLTTPVKLSWEK